MKKNLFEGVREAMFGSEGVKALKEDFEDEKEIVAGGDPAPSDAPVETSDEPAPGAETELTIGDVDKALVALISDMEQGNSNEVLEKLKGIQALVADLAGPEEDPVEEEPAVDDGLGEAKK